MEGGTAASNCSRSTRARCSVKNGWPPLRRSNCRSAERSRRATSSRPPSPGRRRTATASPFSGHFPCLRRRLASLISQIRPPEAAALHSCNTRRVSPRNLNYAQRSCVGGEGGCRCGSLLQIPETFPKCASTGNWQVPSALAESKRSWDPLDSSSERASSRENWQAIWQFKNPATEITNKSYPVDLLVILEALHVRRLVRILRQLVQLHSPCKSANMAHPTARISICACQRDLNLLRTHPSTRSDVKRVSNCS